jgi:hypothetical protein
MFTYEAAIATFLGSTPTHLRAALDGRQGRADGDSVIAVPAIDPKRDYSLSRTQQSADWDEAPQYRNTRAALQDEVI